MSTLKWRRSPAPAPSSPLSSAALASPSSSPRWITSPSENSLRNPTSKAYADVFAPYHGWAIRKAVGAGMYALPTKSQLLKKLNEDEASAKTYMEDYVVASVPLIKYIDELFLSRELGIDWISNPKQQSLVPCDVEKQ